MMSLVQTCLPRALRGVAQSHWKRASGDKLSPKTSIKLLHAKEEDVSERVMPLLMERSQQNTAAPKSHAQRLWFYMANSRKGYCRCANKHGYSLEGKHFQS